MGRRAACPRQSLVEARSLLRYLSSAPWSHNLADECTTSTCPQTPVKLAHQLEHGALVGGEHARVAVDADYSGLSHAVGARRLDGTAAEAADASKRIENQPLGLSHDSENELGV